MLREPKYLPQTPHHLLKYAVQLLEYIVEAMRTSTHLQHDFESSAGLRAIKASSGKKEKKKTVLGVLAVPLRHRLTRKADRDEVDQIRLHMENL